MTRGIIGKKSIVSSLLVCGFLLTSESTTYAGSSARAIESNTGSAAAPTKEDSADYFATSRKGISVDAARKADGLRIKTINSINTLLSDKKNSKNEFELTLRLGELYVERADYIRDQEMADYVAAHDKWLVTDTATRSKNAPQANYKKSEASLYNAVQTFRKIAVKYPKHPRTDATLFSLARTLSRLNDDNASQYYKQLITNHPKSPLIPDAWLALGEIYFDKHQIKEATESYQKVMEFKNHRAYPYAIYKLGWCYYNSQGVNEKNPGDNLKKSIAAFQLVVKLSDKQKSGNFNLREEALRDIVMVFAESEDTERAWTYFKDIGEVERFYTMLQRLGGMYAEAGKNDKAIDVYTRLVKESPQRKDNPEIYKKLVEIYDLSNRFPEVVDTIRGMQNLFARESIWTGANKDNSKLLTDAKGTTERTMHRFGTMFHSRGQKIKNPELENLAADIYTLYLQSFDKLEPAYDIRFYLADIQMSQKKYAQASTNFIVVAQQKPKDGKHLKDAAYNAVDAIASLNSAEKFSPTPPPGQAPSAIEIPKIRKLYISTIDFYVSLLPNENAALPMRYTAAQIFFDYGHYAEAIKRFNVIANNYSITKQGQGSARTIIAYYNEKSDWQNVISFGKKFQANKQLCQDPIIKKFVDDSLRGALFNSAVAFEKSSDYDRAAQAFLEFQNIFPNDASADRALFNASLNQFKSGQIEPSINTQKNLLARYTKSALCPDVMANMGQTYEAIAQFQEASDMYRKLATTYPNDKRAPISLYNAAVLLQGIKAKDAASSVFTEMYKKYPHHELASDAILEAAKIREGTGDLRGAIADYNFFAGLAENKQKNEGLYAQAKSIELRLAQDGKNETARKELWKLSSALRAKGSAPAPAARYTISKIIFNDQESQVRSFNQIGLTSAKEIEHQATTKQARLVKLANNYQEVIALGNAEFSVASYYRLGELHEEFAKALFNVPAPANYSAKDAAEFKSQLEKSAFPLRDQAYKFFEMAYTQSSAVDTFTSWTQKTYQKMIALAPDKHPEIHEQSAKPGYMSYKIAINRATENLAE